MMAKKTKAKMKVTRTRTKTSVLYFPEKSFQEWFTEFIMANLAVEFYGRNKKWPKKLYPDTLKVIDNPDGSGTLTVDLE